MSNKKLTIISLSLLSLYTIATFATFRQQAQDKSPVQNEEATLVQKGHVTEKERAYSKEYRKDYEYRNPRKLTGVKEKGEVSVIIGDLDIPTDPNERIVSATEFLEKKVCEADMVVVGKPVSKTSHLTDDETFVYTEYRFEVENIVKNNSVSPIDVGKSIEITRPGGLIKIDDQIIRVEDRSFEPLKINKEYLLFLKYIPATNGYKAFDYQSDFVVEGNTFKKLSKVKTPVELATNNELTPLLNKAQNVKANDCAQSHKEDK